MPNVGKRAPPESVPVGLAESVFFYSHDLQHRFAYLSPSVTSVLGYSPAELKGVPYDDLLLPGTLSDDVNRRTESALKSGDATGAYHAVVRHRTGRALILELVETPVLGANGAVIGMRGLARDVTERECAVERFEHDSMVLESISDCLFRLDRQWRFTYMNSRAEAFFGGSRASLLGLSIWEAYPDFEGTGMQQRLVAALLSNEPGAFDTKLNRGSSQWIGCRVHPTADGLTILFEDVTTRRRSEEALRASEERLRLALRAGGLGLWEVELATLHLTLSPDLALLHGQQDGNLDMGLDELYERVDAEDLARLTASAERALADGGDYSEQYRVVLADGTVRWVETHGMVVRDGAGVPLRLAGLSADITARMQAQHVLRQSEEYHRALVENGGDLIAVVDVRGRFRYASPSYQRILGHAPDELPASMNVLDLLHPTDRPEAARVLQQLGSRNGETIQLETRALHRDGTYRNLHVSATSMLDAPAVAGIVLNAHDTTERRALEDQLRQSQKMEAVGRLAGGVAHDFNNMLTTIRGHAEFLLEGLAAGEEQLRSDAEQIVRAATSAADLTRQLLLFSRQKVAQRRVVNVNDIVEDMDQLLRRVLGEDIRLDQSLDCAAGLVEIDAGHVEQVLMNLVLNARDAMADGGTIRVATRSVHLRQPLRTVHDSIGPGHFVRLSISDTGGGIDPAVLPLIFEPFFTTKDAGRGTGLGLATVYGIVRDAGGDIRVHTELGVGTTFEVLLPPTAAPGLKGAGTEPARTVGGSETLLLVEDDNAVRSLITRTLRSDGYTVIAAGNGADALQCLSEADHIDLVLTDVVMPGMSGRQLAEKIKQQQPALPILYMSGYTKDEVIRRGVRDSDFTLLEKPFTPRDLAAAVRSVLDGAPAGMMRSEFDAPLQMTP